MHTEDQRRGGASFGDLLGGHADGHAGAADAAVFLWERDREDAVVGEQLLDVLGVLALLVDLGRPLGDLALDDLAHAVTQGLDLLREFEVHGAP